MSLLRRNARRDANEPEIVRYLQGAGCIVRRLSDAGIPDLLVIWRGRVLLVEIKMPRGRYTKAQQEFRSACAAVGCRIYTARSVTDARLILEAT